MTLSIAHCGHSAVLPMSERSSPIQSTQSTIRAGGKIAPQWKQPHDSLARISAR